ncbi:MAG: hypothetical protein MZW92_29280 [Comamonadaceae bacterium]|nr:hypothetical protein [Comamonadaceae bacterium]
MAKGIQIGLLLIAVAGLCNAEEPTLAHLRGSPESIELDGAMLNAVARPYMNLMPTFAVPGQAVDCRRTGGFIVPVEIRTGAVDSVCSRLL